MKRLGGLLYLIVAVLTPVLGVWLASSLVSFHGGPEEIALIAGALLFPVLPVLWELRATKAFDERIKRRKQFGAPPKRAFTALGRIVLRTLALNAAFLAVLALWFPKVAFPALATRGDWFLDGRSEPWAERMREDLHAAASGLEWLYELSQPNPYVTPDDLKPVPSSVKPVEESTRLGAPTARRWIPGTTAWKRSPFPAPPPITGHKLRDGEPEPDPITGTKLRDGEPEPDPITGTKLKDPEPQPDPLPADLDGAVYRVGDTRWPWKNEPVKSLYLMTPQDEESIDAVASYFRRAESDPFRRVKGLHDWVVTRFRYDKQAVEPGGYRPPQDAESVFRARKAVCEGYARLLVALGKQTGDEIVYLHGDVREPDGSAAPSKHAWNGVQIDGKWYLMDATWDDPVSSQDVYRTDYLFIPPSLAVFDHLPWEPRWQLLATPLDRGDFLRQPLARPTFARSGLTLVDPERSTVEVDGPLSLELLNPLKHRLMVTVGSGDRECGIRNDLHARWTCEVPYGVSRVRIWNETATANTYESLAEIRVTRR